MWGRTSVTLYPGMTAMLENGTLDIKNRSHTITAEIEIPQETAQGVIIAQGGRFGGWSLYVKDGKLKYCYNWLDRERYALERFLERTVKKIKLTYRATHLCSCYYLNSRFK